MFTGRVYRIMIGCPSDVKKEVGVAKEVIANWTDLNAEANGMVLLPLHWSSNSYPVLGKHPQKELDKQLVEKSDMLVCIFAAKVGTPTDTAESGSIEEIEEHVKAGKPVMLFFRKQVDITDLKPEEVIKLNDFKKRMQVKGVYFEFDDENDFQDLFSKKLQLFVNDNWLNQSISEIVEEEENKVVFNEKELEIFSKWANDGYDQQYMVLWTRQGLEVHFGYNNGYTFPRGEALASLEGYLKRLLDAGLIEIDHYDTKSKQNIYKITIKGYQFAKSLN